MSEKVVVKGNLSRVTRGLLTEARKAQTWLLHGQDSHFWKTPEAYALHTLYLNPFPHKTLQVLKRGQRHPEGIERTATRPAFRRN